MLHYIPTAKKYKINILRLTLRTILMAFCVFVILLSALMTISHMFLCNTKCFKLRINMHERPPRWYKTFAILKPFSKESESNYFKQISFDWLHNWSFRNYLIGKLIKSNQNIHIFRNFGCSLTDLSSISCRGHRTLLLSPSHCTCTPKS